MTIEHAGAVEDELPTDEDIREMRRRHLADPKIQARAREVLDEIRRGDAPKSPGITAEELPEFLRKHNG